MNVFVVIIEDRRSGTHVYAFSTITKAVDFAEANIDQYCPEAKKRRSEHLFSASDDCGYWIDVREIEVDKEVSA